MNSKKYLNLIDSAMRMPKKEPREISPENIPVFQKVKSALLQTVRPRKNVEHVYRILASALSGSTTTLATRVPVDELHAKMSEEIHKIQAALIMRGMFPFKVFCVSRFVTHFDLGHSRCLCLRVQIMPVAERPSTASFIVEEMSYDEIDFDEINFDLVPSIGDEKREPRINNAVIWKE